MSIKVDILSDTTLGASFVGATLAFYSDTSGNNRTSWKDVGANLNTKDSFQTLTVTNVTPDSNAKYVGIQLWVKTSSSGTSGHVNWTQPYITPYSTLGDYVPDSVSSNQETLIKDGYIRFPMYDSISKGDYNYNIPYYISNGELSISNDGISLFRQPRFYVNGSSSFSVNYYNLDVNYNSISVTQKTFDDSSYYSGLLTPTSLELTNGSSIFRATDSSISVTGGDLGVSSSSGDINIQSPSGKNIMLNPAGGGGILVYSLANFTKSLIVGNGNSGDQIWVKGAGNFDGSIKCKSLTQTSLLSKKTNISKIDTATALDKINQTNIYDYQYKNDVEKGSTKHYASYIIDDVNDVSEYTEPDEFLSEDKKGRDDGSLLAYAVVAIKELIKRNSELQMRVAKLEIGDEKRWMK